MSKYGYRQMYEKHPKFYENFNHLVRNAENFSDKLENCGLLEGTRSMLSIGAGEGELEIGLAKRHGISLGYLDPSVLSSRKFRQAVIKSGATVSELYEGSFEDYTSNAKYDLVISVHSWYPMGCSEKWLQKALDCRAKNGKLFIALLSENSFISKLEAVSEHGDLEPLKAESLSRWAADRGFSHSYVVREKIIPKSTFLDESGQLTEAAQDFATFVNYTEWEELSPMRRAAITRAFQREAIDGDIVLRDGCLIF